MNKIFLEFEKSDTRLAGFPYGKSVYEKQVREKIVNFNESVEIIFPEQIEKVASSFVQGFFSEMICNMGYKGIEKNVIITTCSQELTNSIRDNLY